MIQIAHPHAPSSPSQLQEPPTNKSAEVSTNPNGESEAALAALKAAMHDLINGYAAVPAAGATVSQAKLADRSVQGGAAPSVLMSVAIADYGQLQIQSGEWSHSAFKHTHEPSLRLFQELVGRPMPAAPGEPRSSVIDCPMSDFTLDKLSEFLREFRSFPAQQGKRRGDWSAREALLAGGPPQSRAYVFKRLAHIRQFI